MLQTTWALMVGGACSPLGAKSSYLNSGCSTRHSTRSGGAPRTTAKNKYEEEEVASKQMSNKRTTRVRYGMYRHVCTCWYALAPLPLKASNHLLLCALLLLLLQLHHPLHQHLHLHRSVGQLDNIKREKGFEELT